MAVAVDMPIHWPVARLVITRSADRETPIVVTLHGPKEEAAAPLPASHAADVEAMKAEEFAALGLIPEKWVECGTSPDPMGGMVVGDTVTVIPEWATETTPAAREPTRVFRFRDDAWRCPKDADICRVPTVADCDRCFRSRRLSDRIVLDKYNRCECSTDVAIVDHEGHEAAEHFVSDPPVAERVSTWVEWLDSVIRKAAHDYLDAALDIGREWATDDDVTQRERDESRARSVLADSVVQTLSDCYSWADLEEKRFERYEPAGRSALLARVKADIEARLRGEPGKVELP